MTGDKNEALTFFAFLLFPLVGTAASYQSPSWIFVIPIMEWEVSPAFTYWNIKVLDGAPFLKKQKNTNKNLGFVLNTTVALGKFKTKHNHLETFTR